MQKIPHQKNPNAHFSSFEEYQKIYNYSLENPTKFWWDLAKENLTFFEDFTEVLDETNYPKCNWFKNWKINICYEAIDKNLEKNSEKIAIIFEAENWETKKITYKKLSKKVNKSANLLKNMWVKKWDTILFYMPQILESAYLMLACLRIWAIHSIVFWGFSSESIKERIDDLKPKIIITADWAFRKWKAYFLKTSVDTAIKNANHQVEKVLVIKRNFEKINIWKNEIIYNDEIESQSDICDFEKMDSEDISFVLYTSGSTGKPKWIIHSTAGYILCTKLTSKWVFDMQKDDIFFSSADIGWITGHSYTLYWPLLNWITTILYEWNPLYPKEDRVWEIIEKHKVNTFYTAPTLIRLLHKTWENLPKNFDLSSLKILGTVWEPIDFDAWNWFYEIVWNKKCSLVDTYWQTETWAHILAPLPFATPLKQKSATFPIPWISGEIVDENWEKTEKWFFVITKPWPSMARWIWWDEERFKKTYFSEIFRDKKALYFSGDGWYKDEEGYIFITWRVDDIVNISGHKIWIAEIESLVSELPEIAEYSVVWIPDELTWESLFAYIVEKKVWENKKEEVLQKINKVLREKIGTVVSVKNLIIVSGLPKTRSWKIVRRILRTLAKKEEIKSDISTIENKEVIEEIKETLKNSHLETN